MLLRPSGDYRQRLKKAGMEGKLLVVRGSQEALKVILGVQRLGG